MPIFKKPVTCASNKGATRGAEEEMEDFVNSFSSFKSLLDELSAEEKQQFAQIFNDVIDGVGDKLVGAEDQEMMKEVIADINTTD